MKSPQMDIFLLISTGGISQIYQPWRGMGKIRGVGEGGEVSDLGRPLGQVTYLDFARAASERGEAPPNPILQGLGPFATSMLSIIPFSSWHARPRPHGPRQFLQFTTDENSHTQSQSAESYLLRAWTRPTPDLVLPAFSSINSHWPCNSAWAIAKQTITNLFSQ